MKMNTKLLNQLYSTPNSQAYLAGESSLFREARQKDDTITLAEVRKFLRKQETFRRTNRTNRIHPKSYPKLVVTRPNALMHLDLAFWGKKIIYLIGRDAFSGMTYAQFMGSRKDAKRTLTAFRKIESRVMGGPILHVSFDGGTEFNQVAEYMRDKGLKATQLSSWNHAYLSEAAIKDIREMQRKIEIKTGQRDIRKLMPRIVSVLNMRYSRITKMSPKEATLPENMGKVFTNKFLPYTLKVSQNSTKNTKFKVGDTVKILSLWSASEKTGVKKREARYSSTNFSINRVNFQSFPISYRLSRENGTILQRHFYENHLFGVNNGN